jgi:hypothetical protein
MLRVNVCRPFRHTLPTSPLERTGLRPAGDASRPIMSKTVPEYPSAKRQYRSKVYPFSNPSITNENPFNSEEIEPRIPSNPSSKAPPASASSCSVGGLRQGASDKVLAFRGRQPDYSLIWAVSICRKLRSDSMFTWSWPARQFVTADRNLLPGQFAKEPCLHPRSAPLGAVIHSGTCNPPDSQLPRKRTFHGQIRSDIFTC